MLIISCYTYLATRQNMSQSFRPIHSFPLDVTPINDNTLFLIFIVPERYVHTFLFNNVKIRDTNGTTDKPWFESQQKHQVCSFDIASGAL
jgi:hypothetical protein